MTVSTTTPMPIRLRRKRSYALADAVLAAAALAATLLVVFGTGGHEAQSVVTSAPAVLTSGEQNASSIISSLSPAELRGIRYYWVPGTSGLSPREQRYLNAASSLDLRGVRSYWASSPALKATLLAPSQLRAIRWYYVPASAQ